MDDVIAAPSVRALALNKGIDLARLAQQLGRTTIAREDLDRAPAPAAAVAADQAEGTAYWQVDHAAYGPVREEPLSRFAQAASANLSAANARIPQVTHHDRADVTALEAFRQRLKPEARARGVKLTALAFHLRAVSRALREFPRFNAALSPDGKTLILRDYVHIGIAVDTAHGLMVPVIRDADTKGLWQIASEISDMAARAQARKIRADEMGGASLTITNLGGIGGVGFTPIVNPPELAILGLSRPETVTLWEGEVPRPVSMVPLDLSYDHRVLNGAEAARFVACLARLIADPRRMMV
ncbi:2-oxo acid dehydrogenase subunit E2 [Pseudooceanicola aestuarii]|uniref:2-oxo acid dehydrogenase subunit E2 n=1 Tax=Pseudooceanicola aestuarii TaxID=2697319 RepID=UPI0013D477A0|nr:2-oxo acid dehydrogenase subunit E2 [Pseudooceanicola aestuarii]